MKTYKHLYEEFISEENIRLAIKSSSKGKKKRKDVKRALENEEYFIKKVKNYAENFFNYPHKPKEIYDGIARKKRTIIVPRYIEQVVHHMICQVMMPIFTKGMHEHSYASIPGRGGTKGMKAIKKWIKQGGADIKYCVKLDIKKFFDNVDRAILLNKFKRVIKDSRFIAVLKTLIYIDGGNKGLPLGFFTSQWFANFYLQDLDHYMKEKLHIKYDARYMDDIICFCKTKKMCIAVLHGVKKYLQDNLLLELKSNYQYFRFVYSYKGKNRGRALDFMGFKFYRNKITLRKSILCKMRRKALHIFKKKIPNLMDCKQMLSYLGWLKYTDTYGYYVKYIKGIIDFRRIKKKVSNITKLERNGYYGVEKSRINGYAA